MQQLFQGLGRQLRRHSRAIGTVAAATGLYAHILGDMSNTDALQFASNVGAPLATGMYLGNKANSIDSRVGKAVVKSVITAAACGDIGYEIGTYNGMIPPVQYARDVLNRVMQNEPATVSGVIGGSMAFLKEIFLGPR